MPELTTVRTGLDVGFVGVDFPVRYEPLRGKVWRSIAACDDFPYEDHQFDAVVLHASAVNRKLVKEAHRVLKPEGSLYFTVPERTSRQDGFTLPDIYSIVREGFNIASVERSAWWRVWDRARVFSIVAKKKNWRPAVATYRPLV